MSIGSLYDSYNILLEAEDKITEHYGEYKKVIQATSGIKGEKQLAAQIISKFFKFFPDAHTDAMDAVFNLCEDDDSAIRIAAMKALPSFCKENVKYIVRVADIAAQLLQLEDPQEYNIASNTLLQVLKDDPVVAIKAIFRLVLDKNTDATLREKCLKFALTKVKILDKSVITAELEDLILNEMKSFVQQNTTPEEFILVMTHLVSSKLAQTVTGQQELVDLIADQIEIDQKFDPLDTTSNNADRLITSVNFIIPLFSSKLESTKFLVYYCDQVLSQWNNIATLPEATKYQLAIAQQLAELSQHCGTLENAVQHITSVFERLKEYMPPPPEDTSSTEMPDLKFTMVESLLYAFHKLAKQHTEFLTEDAALLKDFRSRLMYFSRGAQGCLKVLNLSDKEKIFSAEEKRIREISPKMLNNINTLIKDLFYQPPIYKCNLVLSFKKEMKTAPVTTKSPESTTTSSKRHVPITYESNGATNTKQVRQNRTGSHEKKIYTPPSGKFSHNFQNNDRSNNSRFRGGGGRGSNRGSRHRGRGNYRN